MATVIKVIAAAEPGDFDAKVREPGKKFLARCPHPKNGQWDKKEFWRRAIPDLRKAYSEICAFSCFWVPPGTGFSSVDHFEAKADHPEKAYEWSNFRFVCGSLNGKKGTFVVLDPFEVEDGWFVIDFLSLLVKPSAGLDESIKLQVAETCRILGLNNQSTCVAERAHYLAEYCSAGKEGMAFLERNAPFLAKELKRQGLEEEIKNFFS